MAESTDIQSQERGRSLKDICKVAHVTMDHVCLNYPIDHHYSFLRKN
jgi:hypothetical protein